MLHAYSRMAISANHVMHWVVRIFLISAISTLLLLYYVSVAQENASKSAAQIMHKQETIMEGIRRKKLEQLRKVMFIKPLRPEGYVYNLDAEKSEQIPLIREVSDTRPMECRSMYYDTSKLSKFSIIIPFHNEALSMLLRTVHSFLARSPATLLKEIIMIDDASKNEDLKELLEKYVKLLAKVRLLRTTRREGLIRARMIGAAVAKAPVLFFVDAHTEANVGWAEPLLDELRRNPRLVLQPHLDHIDPATIDYVKSSGTVPRGGFSWDLRFVWMKMPEHEKRRRRKDTEPVRMPVLVGCAIMVRKDYFLELGAFDEGMNVWGGENIELSFRTWLCGGQVLSLPCSRIAHAFKEFHYSFDGDKETIVTRNLLRIAHLWMDDYKKFFLASTYSYDYKRTYLEEKDIISLEKRQQLKNKLNCKPFHWYLHNIVPEIHVPPIETVYHGEVKNAESNACWYVKKDKYIGVTYNCFHHRLIPENMFEINVHSLMMHSHEGQDCIRMDHENHLLYVGECPDTPESEHWRVKRKGPSSGLLRLYLGPEDEKEVYCISQVTNVNSPHKGQQMPQAVPCDSTNQFQYWEFTYKFEFDYNFDPPAT